MAKTVIGNIGLTTGFQDVGFTGARFLEVVIGLTGGPYPVPPTREIEIRERWGNFEYVEPVTRLTLTPAIAYTIVVGALQPPDPWFGLYGRTIQARSTSMTDVAIIISAITNFPP